MNNWLKMGIDIVHAVSYKFPIANLIITAIRAIVEKKNDGISNKSVITVVEEMAKSKWNNLNSDKVLRIVNIINEEDNKIQSIAPEKMEAWEQDLEVMQEELNQADKKLSTEEFMKMKEVKI